MAERQQERFTLSPEGDYVDGDEGEGHSDYLKPLNRLKIITTRNVTIDEEQMRMIIDLFRGMTI